MGKENETETPVYGKVCKRKLRRKRQRLLLTELFLDFSKNTTLHGLRYITQIGLETVEKIFWTVTFVASVTLSFYFIYNVWYKWKTSPVIVSFSEKHVSVETVPFPAVTICPQVKSSPILILQKRLRKKLGESNEKNKENQPYFSQNYTYNQEDIEAYSLMCPKKDPMANFPYKKYIDDSVVNQLYNLSLNSQDIFNLCHQYMTRPRICNETFVKSLTKDGICFTYNGLAAHEILRDNVQQEYQYSLANQPSRKWNMKYGYTNDDPTAYPTRGLNTGESRNMLLKLNIRSDIKIDFCDYVYSGYKIYLHHPADHPQSSSYYFAALPNQLSSIALEFTMVKTSSSLKNYPLETRQCYFPEDKWLKYFKIYTYDNCKLECLSNFTYSLCNCVSYYMPHTNSSEICAAETERTCVKPARGSLQQKWKECNCLPACNNIQYDADIHKDFYDISKFIKGNKKNAGHTSPAVAKVEIFFKEPLFMSLRRSELFGLTDFLGQCGGLLGLFLGFSFLSLVEIFYFVTFRVYYTIKTDLKREKSENAEKYKK